MNQMLKAKTTSILRYWNLYSFLAQSLAALPVKDAHSVKSLPLLDSNPIYFWRTYVEES